MIVVLICAIGITIGNAYYSRGTARLVNLPTKEIDRLFPKAKVTEDNGRFRVTLRSRYRPVAEVAQRIGLDQLIPDEDKSDRHEITFESYERAALEALTDEWPRGDIRSANKAHCVISGHITNQHDRPVAQASVTLFRATAAIGEGTTRGDGTFTIGFLKSNQNDGMTRSDANYHLQIRWVNVSADHQMVTRSFTIMPDTQERLVRIRIRQ